MCSFNVLMNLMKRIYSILWPNVMICVPCGPPSFMILVAALVPVSCFFVVNLLLLVYMIVFTFIGWFSLLDRGIRCLNNRSP